MAGAYRIPLWLGALLMLVPGCGGGSSSSSAVISAPISVSAVQVDAALPTSLISFTVVSPLSHPVSVEIQVSQDRGLHFRVVVEWP